MIDKFVKTGVFEDGVFVESWIFCDFPCTPSGQTALDLFEEFVKSAGVEELHRCFIDAMRGSRLGLYQEVLTSKTTIRFKELISEKVVEVFRSIEEFGKGEIFLVRLVPIEGEVFCFGDPKCWPKEYRACCIIPPKMACTTVENMLSLSTPH